MDWLTALSAEQVTAIATSVTGFLLVVVTAMLAYAGIRQLFPFPHVEIDPVGDRVLTGRFYDITVTNDTKRRIYLSHLSGRARPYAAIADEPNPDASVFYRLDVSLAPGQHIQKRLWIGGREWELGLFWLHVHFSRHGRAAKLKSTMTRAYN